ncbi:hypothetical protein YC2023_077551 [Brassica napus]
MVGLCKIESNDDQTRPRQRRGRGGTGSQSRDSSQIQDSASPHSSYHKSPSAFPASAPLAPPAAPAPAPPGPPGVMSVAELVRQPGRDHLPYLTPYPHGRGQTCSTDPGTRSAHGSNVGIILWAGFQNHMEDKSQNNSTVKTILFNFFKNVFDGKNKVFMS